MAAMPKASSLWDIGDVKLALRSDDHGGFLALQSTPRELLRSDYPSLFQFMNRWCATEPWFPGNGTTTFCLAPAGGRFALLASALQALAKMGGADKVTLTAAQLPKHKHTEQKVAVAATPPTPVLLRSVLGIALENLNHPPTTSIGGSLETGEAGGSEAHENMPPYFVFTGFVFAGRKAR